MDVTRAGGRRDTDNCAVMVEEHAGHAMQWRTSGGARDTKRRRRGKSTEAFGELDKHEPLLFLLFVNGPINFDEGEDAPTPMPAEHGNTGCVWVGWAGLGGPGELREGGKGGARGTACFGWIQSGW